MNEALKTKWLWRFASEDEVLWKKVIVCKYDLDRLGWWSKKSHFAHGVGCWKSILSTLDFFKSSVRFEVGNGARVLFWHDKWCGDQPLKAHFPNLFRMASSKGPLWKRFCLGMGVSISGTSLLLEAQTIGKRKAFLIFF